MSKVCTSCGSSISKERLEIVPNSTLCTACKAGQEPRRNITEVSSEFPSSEKYFEYMKIKKETEKNKQDAIKKEVIRKKVEAAKYETPPKCPNCEKAMVMRVRQKDNYPFYGCTGYPECRFTLETYIGKSE